MVHIAEVRVIATDGAVDNRAQDAILPHKAAQPQPKHDPQQVIDRPKDQPALWPRIRAWLQPCR